MITKSRPLGVAVPEALGRGLKPSFLGHRAGHLDEGGDAFNPLKGVGIPAPSLIRMAFV